MDCFSGPAVVYNGETEYVTHRPSDSRPTPFLKFCSSLVCLHRNENLPYKEIVQFIEKPLAGGGCCQHRCYVVSSWCAIQWALRDVYIWGVSLCRHGGAFLPMVLLIQYIYCLVPSLLSPFLSVVNLTCYQVQPFYLGVSIQADRGGLFFLASKTEDSSYGILLLILAGQGMCGYSFTFFCLSQTNVQVGSSISETRPLTQCTARLHPCPTHIHADGQKCCRLFTVGVPCM